MCLGWNYADHSREAAAARGREAKLPQHPIVFTKATRTANGPYARSPTTLRCPSKSIGRPSSAWSSDVRA